MVDHTEAVHVVEARVGKGQLRLGVGKLESPSNAEQVEALTSHLDPIRRQIHSDIARPALRELEAVGCDSAPDFQHVLPAKAVEVRDVRNVPFPTAETLARDLFEIVPPVLLGRESSLAGILVPKSLHVIDYSVHVGHVRSLSWPVRARWPKNRRRRASCSPRWRRKS